MIAALAAAAIAWLAMAMPVAMLVGRSIRNADRRTTSSPPVGVAVGEAPRARRSHLHAV